MSTDSFRRHARTSVDAALHQLFASVRDDARAHAFLDRLLRAVRASSDLVSQTPAHVRVLQNLLPFEHALVRAPEQWTGARGHGLVVVQSLASHLFARYDTPRFLASVWFGDDSPSRIERRSWSIAHACGQRFRSLELPISMTRKMEHLFLQTPDHYSFDHALRRAEVLALGGSTTLAEVVLSTPLGEDFTNAEKWHRVLAWLVRFEDSVELAQVRPLVDFMQANLHTIDIRKRTFASVIRLVRDWHGWLGRQTARVQSWPRSRWHEMLVTNRPTTATSRPSQWKIVELVDSRELAYEGRCMRHCVSLYAARCVARRSAIWSLRFRFLDELTWRCMLTIEVRPSTETIVQLRGKANALPRGEPLELVRRWATREGLRWHPSVELRDRVAA